MRKLLVAFFLLLTAPSVAGILPLLGVGANPPVGCSGVGFDGTNTNVTISNCLTVQGTGGIVIEGARSLTFHSTGKFYFEATVNASGDMAVAIAQSTATYSDMISLTNLVRFAEVTTIQGDIWAGGGFFSEFSGSVPRIAPTNTLSVAVDLGTHKYWVTRNCSANWNTTSDDPTTGVSSVPNLASASFAPAVAFNTGDTTGIVTYNFGGTSYRCTPPTGFGNW